MVIYMTNIFQDSGSSIDPMLAPVIVAGIRVLTAGLAAFVLRYASRQVLIRILPNWIVTHYSLYIKNLFYGRVGWRNVFM